MAVLMIGTLWVAGEQATWSPNFTAQALSPQIVNSTDASVQRGAQLFHSKGCGFCHTISGTGGERGPKLTLVGDRITSADMTTRILNGGVNMPAYGSILTPQEVDDLVAFLRSRKSGP